MMQGLDSLTAPPVVDCSTGAGLYIHVPFCSGKCPYCDFLSLAAPRLIPGWREGLLQEAALYQASFDTFRTLYLGGGTPSLLDIPDLAAILTGLRRTWSFDDQAELTLEANPEDVSPDKAAAWLELGVNRLSLGVQSLNDQELKFLGRRHDAATVRRAWQTLRRSGCDNLSLDLIYGLPGQSLAAWLAVLDQALDLEPEHLSCYSLTFEGRTPFARKLRQGELTPPDEEEARRFFLATSQRIRARGYVHYEVSNFARSKDLIARHNSGYWSHLPYLGLGPAAHSLGGGKRWWNTTSLKQYARFLEQDQRPLAGEETLSLDQLNLEKMFLGLRTATGAPKELAELLAGPDRVAQAIDQGLVIETGPNLTPTFEGLAVADALAAFLTGI